MPGRRRWLRRRRGGSPRRRLRDRRGARMTAAVFAVLFAWFSWSMGHALTAPGGGTVAERVAEWARDHYLGPVVTFGEWLTYQPPKVGGKPSFSLAVPATGTAPVAGPGAGQPASSVTAHRRRHHHRPAGDAAPARLRSPAGKPLRGEGVWRVLGKVHGVPAMYATYLRPDSVHTSYVAGIVSMNQRLLRFELHPGSEDPGPGRWGKAQPTIPPRARRGLRATFNGGFKIASAGGGFYLNGTYRGTLRKGAASMVYYRDGRLAIGVWGHGLRMTHQVVGVRQNLRPIVANGHVPSSVDSNVQTSWGATLGGGYYVWRSGVGVTSGGRIIFVYGPALDVRTLASLLKRAGCVEAMELDINPDWMSYMSYHPRHHPADPVPANLLPDQVQSPGRYYVLANRDFTAVYAR
ncbi:MAG: hypothetical protein ABJB47_11905 [Actinomycetota bacterium]